MRRHSVSTHSELLLPLIAECLGELGMQAGELSAVACGAGPGSFTGLRIGLSTAKGLCFALGLPLLLVSSLEALAHRALSEAAQSPPRPVLAVLDAFRGQVFARLCVPEQARTATLSERLASHPQLAGDAVWAPAALAEAVASLGLGQDLLLCGGGLDRYPRELLAGLPEAVRWDDDPAPHPLDVAQLGARELRAGRQAPLQSSVPNYICVSAPEEALLRMAAGSGAG